MYVDNTNVIGCIFSSNSVYDDGGGIYWHSHNGKLINSTFNDNSAHAGVSVYWDNELGSMINCNFIKSGDVYANSNININGGSGILEISTDHIISGISIVVLNNETYYYPPSTNINLTNKIMFKIRQKSVKKVTDDLKS